MAIFICVYLTSPPLPLPVSLIAFWAPDETTKEEPNYNISQIKIDYYIYKSQNKINK